MSTIHAFRYTALFLATIILVSATGLRYASAAERPAHLRMLSGPSGGQWHAAGERLATILTHNIVPTTSRIGGGAANIVAIDKRLGDIGFTLTCLLGAAQTGEQEFQSMITENVALMTNVHPQVLYFLLRKDVAQKHGITDVASLLQQRAPLRFASLKPGSASEFILNIVLKYGYDTNYATLRAQGWLLEFGNYAELSDNFVEGKLDCFAYIGGTEVPLILSIEKHTEVVFLPIEQKVLDLLAAKFKTGTYTIMPGTYKSIAEPVTTLGDSTCIIVRKDLPDDLVYEITKTLWENKASLVEAVKDFQSLSPKNATPPGFDLHPGSKKFWDSVQ